MVTIIPHASIWIAGVALTFSGVINVPIDVSAHAR